jgi:hypothetical protein
LKIFEEKTRLVKNSFKEGAQRLDFAEKLEKVGVRLKPGFEMLSKV